MHTQKERTQLGAAVEMPPGLPWLVLVPGNAVPTRSRCLTADSQLKGKLDENQRWGVGTKCHKAEATAHLSLSLYHQFPRQTAAPELDLPSDPTRLQIPEVPEHRW